MKGLGAQERIPDARESSLKRREVLGAKETLSHKSISWLVAVGLDFTKAILTLYLLSSLPKSTHIISFQAAFCLMLSFCPRKGSL